MLILTRAVDDGRNLCAEGRGGENEIVLLHPTVGRVLIRLFPAADVPVAGFVNVGVTAPDTVRIVRGELTRPNPQGA